VLKEARQKCSISHIGKNTFSDCSFLTITEAGYRETTLFKERVEIKEFGDP
jgi:hypothetical protein